MCLPRSWNSRPPKRCSTVPLSLEWGCCPGHGSHWQIPAGWRDLSPSRPPSGLAPDLLWKGCLGGRGELIVTIRRTAECPCEKSVGGNRCPHGKKQKQNNADMDQKNQCLIINIDNNISPGQDRTSQTEKHTWVLMKAARLGEEYYRRESPKGRGIIWMIMMTAQRMINARFSSTLDHHGYWNDE